MATITDHRISNSQHKTGVNGHFSDDGKRTHDSILCKSNRRCNYVVKQID